MSEPSSKRQKTTSSATGAGDVKMRITDLPEDILRRIFKIGVQQTWTACGFDSSDFEDDWKYQLEISHDYWSSGIIEKPKAPFKNYPEVLQAINCAQVCRGWWKVISCDDIWKKLDLSDLRHELDPTLCGSKLNHLLRDVEVLLVCGKRFSAENVNKIMQAAKSSRTRFVLHFPGRRVSASHRALVWNAIKPHLRAHATTLIAVGYPTAPGLFSFMADSPWTKLEELHLRTNASFNSVEESSAMIAANEALKRNKFVPLFPSLKKLYMVAHPNDKPPRWASCMAPNLDYFELDMRCYKKDPVQGWDTHRNSLIHSEFLKTGKYRTYITPARMRVYTKPGPKQISPCPFKLYWELKAMRALDHGVLVSEYRNGCRFERRLTFDEFAVTRDLTRIKLRQSSL